MLRIQQIMRNLTSKDSDRPSDEVYYMFLSKHIIARIETSSPACQGCSARARLEGAWTLLRTSECHPVSRACHGFDNILKNQFVLHYSLEVASR